MFEYIKQRMVARKWSNESEKRQDEIHRLLNLILVDDRQPSEADKETWRIECRSW